MIAISGYKSNVLFIKSHRYSESLESAGITFFLHWGSSQGAKRDYHFHSGFLGWSPDILTGLPGPVAPGLCRLWPRLVCLSVLCAAFLWNLLQFVLGWWVCQWQSSAHFCSFHLVYLWTFHPNPYVCSCKLHGWTHMAMDLGAGFGSRIPMSTGKLTGWSVESGAVSGLAVSICALHLVV